MRTDTFRRGLRLRLVVFLLAAAVAGCSSPDSAPVRIGTNLWIGYEPLYIARHIGALPDAEVRLVELPATTDVIHALRAGVLEGAALTLDEVLRLREEGLELQVLLVLDISAGADSVIGRPTISNLADLRGVTVGYEPSAVGAVMLEAALAEAGLARADIRLIALTPDEHLRAFESGKVDALVTYEPVRSRLLNGGARLLFDSSRIPGQIVDVLAIRSDVARRNPTTLKRLVVGWYRGVEYHHTVPEAALRISAERQHLSPEELAQSYAGLRLAGPRFNREQLQGNPPPLIRSAQALGDLMVSAGLLRRPPDTSDLLVPRGLIP